MQALIHTSTFICSLTNLGIKRVRVHVNLVIMDTIEKFIIN